MKTQTEMKYIFSHSLTTQ